MYICLLVEITQDTHRRIFILQLAKIVAAASFVSEAEQWRLFDCERHTTITARRKKKRSSTVKNQR